MASRVGTKAPQFAVIETRTNNSDASSAVRDRLQKSLNKDLMERVDYSTVKETLLQSLGFDNVNDYSIRVLPSKKGHVFSIANNSKDKVIIEISYIKEEDGLVIERCIIPKLGSRKIIELCTAYVSNILSIDTSKDLMREIESALVESEEYSNGRSVK